MGQRDAEADGQLSLADMPRPLARVTPARLATWDDCRRRYRLTYLDRPAPPRGGPMAHATLGAVVHTALRALAEVPPARRDPERAAALVGTHWRAAGADEGGFRDRAQAAEYRARAQRWVADYTAAGTLGEPLAVERRVVATLDDVVAEGRVDRIDPGADGEAVVVDYKTGRGVPDEATARSAPALALYALATGAALRRRCRRVELHHLPSGTVAAAEHDDASLAHHLTAVRAAGAACAEAAEALAAGADPDRWFPPDPGPRCGRCEVRRSCPEGRTAAPPTEPWALLAP